MYVIKFYFFLRIMIFFNVLPANDDNSKKRTGVAILSTLSTITVTSKKVLF